MKLVMDSDCLVKLTKAGAKEAILSGIEVFIPALVKKETVDEAKDKGHQDSLMIEENLRKKMLHVVDAKRKKQSLMAATKGEEEVVSVYLSGTYDAVASDDRRFLKRLGSANIPYLTPTACLVYLYKEERIEQFRALQMLESLKPFVSSQEYAVARIYMERKP
jgi:rRNA-processing protein FCF1